MKKRGKVKLLASHRQGEGFNVWMGLFSKGTEVSMATSERAEV